VVRLLNCHSTIGSGVQIGRSMENADPGMLNADDCIDGQWCWVSSSTNRRNHSQLFRLRGSAGNGALAFASPRGADELDSAKPGILAVGDAPVFRVGIDAASRPDTCRWR
jgi:hypothetical protein